MKKSNKQKINSEELLKDFDKIMSFISKWIIKIYLK